MILFITNRPNQYTPLEKGHFFRGSYHSYFFYQVYSQGLNHAEIKLLFIDQYDPKKLTDDIKIIVPLGKEAFKRFDPKLSLEKARGSIFKEQINGIPLYVIPTFHPEELKLPYRLFMDASIEKSYCFRQDIRKIKYTLYNGFNQPEERFNIQPTIEEVEQYFKEAIDNNYLLGTDIEATGLSLEYAQIVCIGFAHNESDCLVVPLTKEGGASYWKGEDQRKIISLLNDFFSKGRFLFQNGIGYDVPLLRQRGFKFPLTSFTDDTMLLHHALNPELPHNIGFISSFYGQQPYWKGDFLNKKVHIHHMDQKVMLTYNARDCVALHQIYKPMLEELKEKELEEVYKLSMNLCPAIIEMQETGLLIDESKLRSWRSFLNKEIKVTQELLYSTKRLPFDFKFTSGDHLTWLLYGVKPPSFNNLEKLEEWKPKIVVGYRCSECTRKINIKYFRGEEYNDSIKYKCPKCKNIKLFDKTDDKIKAAKAKSKTSQDYIKLNSLLKVSKIKPFKPPRAFSIPTTKSGYGTDKIAIAKYIIAINKRLEELDILKRRTDHHREEHVELLKLLKYLIILQKYNTLIKMKSSFYNFKPWRDGRVRPSILIQGTSTGRFSCKSPNLQQAPAHGIGAKMRDVFRARTGWKLLSIDFSNLEVQVGARFMDDEVLIAILETVWINEKGETVVGLNMHDENTKTFFKVTKKSPIWKHLRFAAKKIMFGRLLYGGTDNGIYTKVMTEVPECGLTLKKFKEAVNNYMKSHPSYLKWVDKMIELAHTKRISINAYGRKRYLYDNSNKIERQALNTPIQGSSADTINQDIVLVYKELLKRKLRSKLVLAVHDELIFECPIEELKEVYELAKAIMTRVRTIGEHKFTIPIDAEIGQNWGSLKAFNEETMEELDGSKH